MGIEESPNRVVRTVSSKIAFIGHGLETDGDILIELFVDSQSNEITFKSMSKARYGKDFVEANESVQPLIDYANSTTPYPPPETIVEDTPVVVVEESNAPLWQQLGYANKQEWITAGKPGKK